jgi:NarL family two-component system sensor histidine kinase LiaS
VEERNRLARDLHDTVKQQTYAARMQLTAAKNLLGSNGQAAAEHIEAALQLNRETQQELKLIIDELRPAALEGRGLAQALTEYAARWQEHTGIIVTTSISSERSLPFDVEQVLYRVLQEALANVARHAEADSVAQP